jgi:hypothetical protein
MLGEYHGEFEAIVEMAVGHEPGGDLLGSVHERSKISC